MAAKVQSTKPTVRPKPALTEAEQAIQRKQGVLIQEDIRRIISIDINRPFINLEDAVQRLLPMHVSHWPLLLGTFPLVLFYK